MRHERRPRSILSLASYLFLFIGLVALIEMISHAVRGSFRFNFGILGIGIFAGLRRYSRIWRTCALLFTWYGIITLSIALCICLYSQSPLTSAMSFDQRFSIAPANWLSLPLIMVLLVTLWQYRVLTHPAVRRLFDEEPPPLPATEPGPVNAEIDGAVVK
jgi:hypothetical protein